MAKRTPVPLKRRAHVAEPERHFYVYCEGTKTEPEYLRNVGRRFKRARIVAVPVGGVPRTVAERAIERTELLAQRRRPRQRTSSFEENDQVWAVIDRDEHPEFENVLAMCRARRVRVVQSNPCFELWLVLHLEHFDKPIHSGGIQARLHELFPQYDHERSPAPNFEALLDGMPEAEQRATRQLQARVAEQTPFGNPSTTVGHLTHTIREAHEFSATAAHKLSNGLSERCVAVRQSSHGFTTSTPAGVKSLTLRVITGSPWWRAVAAIRPSGAAIRRLRRWAPARTCAAPYASATPAAPASAMVGAATLGQSGHGFTTSTRTLPDAR